MVTRILKIELILMAMFTFISFLSFYYQDSLPDSFFSISSEGRSYNLVSYYFSSVVIFIGHMTGPWVFFPFLVFCLFYAFVYAKRTVTTDSINVLLLMAIFLLGTYLLFPLFIGRGLLYLLRSFLPEVWAVGLLPALIVAFFALSFREKFIGKIKEGFLLFFTIPLKIWEYLKTKRDSLTKKPKMDRPLARKPLTNLGPKPFAFQETGIGVGEEEKKYFDVVSQLGKKIPNNKRVNPPESYFNKIIESIESKLGEFQINGEIINVLKGPVVDTFELELGPGIKVSKVNQHVQDLSMALLGVPIRVVYPMRGRSTVGIEVPRNPREMIYFGEVLHSKQFLEGQASLPICMGRDAFGEVFVADLGNMPHMLVAGVTGAGKSVFLNTLLFSLLVKHSSKTLKLLLIDPKQLELALYADIPHLAMPVITDPIKSGQALKWACIEMERRYSLLKEMGVRNLEGYNEKVGSASPNLLKKIGEMFPEETQDYFLPYIVIIIDEFADLILSKAGKEIENKVCRMAAKARAAGIHLVLATQRPSVDVITGLIKSNFPTRVSFKVTTGIDSRTILNSMGAELLLGKGDMLYKSGIETIRLHGAYLEEKEIEEMSRKLKSFRPKFDQDAISFLQEVVPVAKEGSTKSDDELFLEAVKIIVEMNQASASLLQRRLRIGYNRAANLVEEMESKGLIGPSEGAKPRRVLPKAEEFSP